MENTSAYQISTADWRRQLRLNEKRTRIVIFLFILLYLAVGFLVDVYWNTGKPLYSQTGVYLGFYTPGEAIKALLTLQVIPYVTCTMTVVALISLLITYSFHDKIVMLGTSYREVTSNSSDPDERQLYNVVEEMKVAAGLRYMPKVFIIEANYMNAFASGYSEKSALVAITRGLLKKLDRSELQAVMAHELSHIRHHDIKLTLMASVLTNLMLVMMDILFYRVLFGANRRKDSRFLFIILLLRYVLPIITTLLMLYLSRTREFMADAGCVQLMRDNQPLARALIKIHDDHRANRSDYASDYRRTPHEEVRRAAYLYDPSYAGLKPTKSISSAFSTHPSLKDRLNALGYKKKSRT